MRHLTLMTTSGTLQRLANNLWISATVVRIRFHRKMIEMIRNITLRDNSDGALVIS